jgi:uncharacterized protein YukE
VVGVLMFRRDSTGPAAVPAGCTAQHPGRGRPRRRLVRLALVLAGTSPCLVALAAAPASVADTGPVRTLAPTFARAASDGSSLKAAPARRPHRKSLPRISGTLEDGQILTASDGSWKGSTPLSFSYQWEECPKKHCAAIAGATETSYRLTTAEIGRKMTVLVTARNSAGTATAKAKATGAVAAGPPVNTAPPIVAGTPLPGQTLSASSGAWVGTSPLEYSYQWRACNVFEVCADIPEATGSSYTVEPLQVAESLEVVVTATNSVGSSSVTSEATSLVGALLPSDVTLPSITGALVEGGLLSTSTGSWSGTVPISYGYQWELCNAAGEACREISGASEPTLSLVTSDIGSTLRVVVTATNTAGSTSVTSPATSLVQALVPSNISLPSITGSLVDGQLLSAVSGTWSGTAPISYGYQWELCNAAGEACNEISGALESTLSLLTSDIGSTLRVLVTATNAAGSTSVTSPATSVVKALLPSNGSLPNITGTLAEGGLLSASSGSWSGTAPISYGYQWELCNATGEACKEISGALESTLSLVTGDIGSTVRVIVTASNTAGATSVTSPPTSLVKGLVPSNTSLPTIGGLLQVGKLLTAASGSWSGTAPITYSYQWQTCNLAGEACKNIAEATKDVLTLAVGDLGLRLRVVVTAMNTAGSASATSAATGLIEGLL